MSTDFIVELLGTGMPAPAANWSTAARLLRLHGLEGLAVARHRAAGEALLPAELARDLEPAYRAQGLRTTLLLESAARARGVLVEAGVPALLFKGAALVADGTYPDPGARRMDDVDLLVPPGEVERAMELLGAAGFRPVTTWDPGRPGWVDAVALVDLEAPPGTEATLDLHWRTAYDRLRFGGDGRSSLWEGADLVGGTPSPEAHLVIVAEHLLKHLRFKVHLAAWGDLARLAHRVADWTDVEARVGRSRLERALRALLCAAARDLGAPVPRPLAEGVPGRLAGELAPAALVGRIRPVEGRLAGIVHRWRMLGSVRRIGADLGEAAFPPGAWLRARYGRGGPGGWLRYVEDVARWSAYRGRSPASPNQEMFSPTARE